MTTDESNPKERQNDSDAAGAEIASESYENGYGKPPKEYQFKPGQSGNPNGRPKERRNRKTVMREIVDQTYPINVGDSKKKLDLISANLLAHGVKGAKGDARSFNFFMKAVEKLDLLDDTGENNSVTAITGPKSSPAEALFKNVDQALLSREEMIEMSRLAEVIDLGGDFTALSVADYTLLKKITEKGRGKDITPLA
jgi:Family of unknown function (DUF5681)